MSETRRICVIGGGLSGILVLKYYNELIQSNRNHNFEIQLFEMQGSFGGIWNYTPEVDPNERDWINRKTQNENAPQDLLTPHSPVYTSLRTNLPSELMEFHDFPIKSEACFPHHSEVLTLLRDYSQNFGLASFARFNTKVTQVELLLKLEGEGERVWKVTSNNVLTGEVDTQLFHYVIVCNGHHNVPYVPAIPGVSSFPGQVIHARSYRNPADFADKVVLVVGGNFSGFDIVREISHYAKSVLLSTRDTISFSPGTTTTSQTETDSKGTPIALYPNYDRIQNVRELKEVHGDQCLFGSDPDGISHQVDVIIFATGYDYSFPFLPEQVTGSSAKLIDDSGRSDGRYSGNSVNDLFLHLWNVYEPSLMFVGIPFRISPFHFVEYQARAVMGFVRGGSLPSLEKRLDYERLNGKREEEVCLDETVRAQRKLKLFEEFKENFEKQNDDPQGKWKILETVRFGSGSRKHHFGTTEEFLYCNVLSFLFGGPYIDPRKLEARLQTLVLRKQYLGY